MTQTRRALVLAVALAVGGVAVARAQASLHAIWGSGPTDVWAVGGALAAVHFDGQAWVEVPYGAELPGDINAVWGSGPNSVFVGGEGGAILRWNGQAWTRMTVPTDRQIVALAGRSAAEVYALAQSGDEREAPLLLSWNGRVWASAPLPMAFRANALLPAGVSLLAAGFVANDPTPSERRTYGVLARRTAGRWVATGWNGKAVTDSAIAGASWRRAGAAGTAVLLAGQRENGDLVVAISRGGARFQLLPPVGAGETYQNSAFLASDGVPVAFSQGLIARYTGGAWAIARGAASLSVQDLQAVAQNPMAFAAQQAAWGEFGDAEAAWGSSTDFHAVTSGGRIIRVQGSAARVEYDPTCNDPQRAALNPVCANVQQRTATPARRALPMPSIRIKRP